MLKNKLDYIRQPVTLSISKNVCNSLLIFALGIVLGLVSKVLDETPSNMLPQILQPLDLGNFFSRMGFWLFSGICVSVFSSNPLRAALNTFLFLAGMVGSYYAYTVFVAGFYPKSYMMIWVGMAILSPIPAFVCWYAKSTHIVSLCISTVLVMFMARQAFVFGFWYFDVRYPLELLLFLGTFGVLYKTPKQTLLIGISGMMLFFLLSRCDLMFGLL